MIFLLVALLVLLHSGAQAATTIQNTAGDCSPTITDVKGNITINCPGVPLKALNRLNELLDLKDKDFRETRENLSDKIKEANEWARKYRELQTRLIELGETNELSTEAERFLQNGEFEKAATILDQLLEKEERQIDRMAANHYSRARRYDLQFQSLKSLPHYESAYRYRPQNFQYANAYAATLYKQEDFTKAEQVLTLTLTSMRDLAAADPTAHRSDIADTLINLGMVYGHTQKLTEAESTYKKALTIYRDLAATTPAAYRPKVAATFNNLGIVYGDVRKFTEAEVAFRHF
jgi:tetratricopeptide (TPR) repeat protein